MLAGGKPFITAATGGLGEMHPFPIYASHIYNRLHHWNTVRVQMVFYI